MHRTVSYLFAAFLLLLGACTPHVQRPGETIQSVKLTDTTFFTQDGAELPLQTWPAASEEKAIIIAVHGFNDYSNGFAFPASWWMQNGVTTYAYDQRGFGKTNQIGIWATEELLIADLKAIIREVKARNQNTPVFVLGESMGGSVVMAAADDPDFPTVQGIILSAPGVWGWQSLNLFYKSALWITAHLFPDSKASGRGLGIQASDNISVLRNLGRDPLFIKETRFDSIYGLVGLMDSAYDSPEKLTMPLLILYGANDQIIPKAPVEVVVSRLPETADIVLYKDGWHLLMRDLQAPVVWHDILSWMDNREIPSGNKIKSLPLFP